jgi:protein PsiE
MTRIIRLGHKAITWAKDVGLLIVATSTVIAGRIEITALIGAKTVALADLLLLFIYLEVLAMVATYLDSGKLPVRMPLYIAIVASARYLILDMKTLDSWRLVGIAGLILLISLARSLYTGPAIPDSVTNKRVKANAAIQSARKIWALSQSRCAVG